ncbi:MAG TPA: hypothetical protein VJB16_03200 [archaeon]|nr:hypothetical protein [archaeon]
MDAAEYQQAAARTLIAEPEKPLTPTEHLVAWSAVGLAGETGELLEQCQDAIGIAQAVGAVCELVKKQAFYGQGLRPEALQDALRQVLAEVARTWRAHPAPGVEEEVGDLLWYAAAMCTRLGLKLADIAPPGLEGPMAANIAKLEKRLPNGWNAADQAARRDKQ